MITTVTTAELFFIVGYLMVYMYLAVNFLMMVVARKVFSSPTDAITFIQQILKVLRKTHNPQEHLLARFYFFWLSYNVVCRHGSAVTFIENRKSILQRLDWLCRLLDWDLSRMALSE